jgi:hypothetical protein
VVKTYKETVGRANKRDNRFNRELGRRLKRQVLCIGRKSRNCGWVSNLVVEFRDAKTANRNRKRLPRLVRRGLCGAPADVGSLFLYLRFKAIAIFCSSYSSLLPSPAYFTAPTCLKWFRIPLLADVWSSASLRQNIMQSPAFTNHQR